MTDRIRDRIHRAHELFEQIRSDALEDGVQYDIYRAAINGSSILECVLEDLDDDASSSDELRHDLDKELR